MMGVKGCLWVLLLISVEGPIWALGTPAISCNQVHAAARIVGSTSPVAVNEERKSAPSGFVIEIVAAFRAFELQPKNRPVAVLLLEQIPSDESQQEVLSALDAAVCDDESVAEMKALARVKYGFPQLLARAVEIAPEYMRVYIRYSLIALNPHSDYAVQMQRVCRSHPREFKKALSTLPETDRRWFAKDVFDPNHCRAIAIPEQ
jgi:hypothetical protein